MLSNLLEIFKKKEGYESEFNQALKLAHKWRLATPKFTPSSQPFINKESSAKFNEIIQKILGPIPPEHISQQCFIINALVKEDLEDVFKTPLYYTLGYVSCNKRPMFFTPINELHQLLKHGFKGGAINLHAWLTTPHYEIIDLTCSTTVGFARNDPQLYGRIALQHHSQFNEGMIHHPQLVGEDFLREINALIELEGRWSETYII